MRKIGFKEALKRGDWFSKYVFPLVGIGLICLDELSFVLLGIIFLGIPFSHAHQMSRDMIECECGELVHKRDKYCRYCGKKIEKI